jgi:hypothetical protein
MGSVGGTRGWLAAACGLLSLAAVSCSSPAPDGVTASTGLTGSPTAAASPVHVTGMPTGPQVYPTTSVPNGCRSGTVAITRHPADTQNSSVCVTAGALLRLTLDGRGLDGWVPLQVTPGNAATVAYTTEATDVLLAVVSPTGKASFCLSTSTRSLASQPVSSWQLCVTVRG